MAGCGYARRLASTVARVAGIALIGARHRLLARPEMLFYSAAVGLYLAYVGLAGSSAGILLWPAIALHLYQRPYALTAAHCREVIEETMSGWSSRRTA